MKEERKEKRDSRRDDDGILLALRCPLFFSGPPSFEEKVILDRSDNRISAEVVRRAPSGMELRDLSARSLTDHTRLVAAFAAISQPPRSLPTPPIAHIPISPAPLAFGLVFRFTGKRCSLSLKLSRVVRAHLQAKPLVESPPHRPISLKAFKYSLDRSLPRTAREITMLSR